MRQGGSEHLMNWRGGSIKRDKYDEVFSFLVRERADYRCERCGRSFRHNPGSLHCSHIFGRAKQSVRLHPDNALAHCGGNGCHEHLSQHPVEFAEHAREKLGARRYDRLRVLANKPTKFTAFERELLHKHYLSEKRRLLAMRKAGVTGRIEFSMLGEAVAA